METLREVFDPHFLLRNSLYTGFLVGATCPLIGMYLIVRRLVFMGVALPQISSCGIALAFALPGWGLLGHAHKGHFEGDERTLALAGSTVVTMIAIGVLAWLEKRRRGSAEGRVGTLYVLAGAWSILLLVNNPTGERGLLELLKGEIIAVSNLDLGLTAVTCVLVVLTLVVFQKEFLLVSFDREMAISLKKNILVWDALLFLLIGLTVCVSVLSVGPMVTFGFLLMPPLIAHRFASTMMRFALLAAAIGGVASLVGFCLAYRWDLPVGPTDVALLGVIYGVTSIGHGLWGRLRKAEYERGT